MYAKMGGNLVVDDYIPVVKVPDVIVVGHKVVGTDG